MPISHPIEIIAEIVHILLNFILILEDNALATTYSDTTGTCRHLLLRPAISSNSNSSSPESNELHVVGVME